MYDSEKRKLLENIPEDIYEILKEQQCFVAGGAITSLFTNRKINDIDVYFRSQEHLRRAHAPTHHAKIGSTSSETRGASSRHTG